MESDDEVDNESERRNNVRITSTSRSQDDANNDDGLFLENVNDLENSASASVGVAQLTNLHQEVKCWCLKAKTRLSMTGVAHKVNVDESQRACEYEAQMNDSAEYLRRRDIRMKRMRRSVENNNMPKTMISWFSEDYVVRRLGDDNDDIDSPFMNYPDPYNQSNRNETTSNFSI